MSKIDPLRQIASLNQNAKLSVNRNPQEALAFANEALALALAIQDLSSIGASHWSIGNAQWRLGRLFDAITSLQKADDINKHLEQTVNEIEILNTLGNIYLDLKFHDLAFTYYQLGYHVAHDQDAVEMVAIILSNIGEIYRELNDYDAALEHYHLSLESLHVLESKELTIYPLANMGAVYLAQGRYALAQENTQRALDLARHYEDKIIESSALKLLGILAKKNLNYPMAAAYLDQSLRIYSETKEHLLSTEVLFELHDLAIEQFNLQQALNHLNEVLRIGEAIGAKHILKKAYQRLIKHHQALNNHQEAFYAMEKFVELAAALEDDHLEQKKRSIQFMRQADVVAQERENYFRLHQQLEQAYQSAEVIHAIGRKVTATTDLEVLYHLVYENLSKLMASTTFGIAIHNDALHVLHYQFLIVDDVRMEHHHVALTNKKSLAAQSFTQNRSLVIQTRADIKKFLKHKPCSSIGNVMNSMMFVPLVIEDKAIGIITLQSSVDHAFNEQSLKTLETLATYIAIAIHNTQKNYALKNEIMHKNRIQEELAVLNKELQNLCEIDGLTGIANRRRFDEFYAYEFKRCLRSQEWLSLMMMDIDYFKEYNDHYGHLQGDQIIIHIAKLIAKHAKRSSDLAVRFGGDEFIVVLSNTPRATAEKIALNILTDIKQQALVHANSPIAKTITLSIGITSVLPYADLTMQALLTHTDQALYKAKVNGRNQIQSVKIDASLQVDALLACGT